MKEKILEAIEIAKLTGAPWVEVDGVKIPVTKEEYVTAVQQSDDEIKRAFMDVEFDYTDEEILYWATPYFDELQENKKAKQDALAEEKQLRDEVDHGENSQ